LWFIQCHVYGEDRKSRRLCCVGHVTGMGELKNAYRILVGYFLENSLLKVSEGLGKITLRWILGW